MEQDPIKFFATLFEQIKQTDVPEPSAFILSTASRQGKPSARVVLLKSFDRDGFVFYTNLESRKGKELAENPQAALCFYWEPINYQVRIEGTVQKVSDGQADTYFASRPQGSQIGAWASKQSSEMISRDALEEKFLEYEKKFSGQAVPRPDFWSGFNLKPQSIEFWKREENRLHARTLFRKKADMWEKLFLYP